jgi:hypothetical protein
MPWLLSFLRSDLGALAVRGLGIVLAVVVVWAHGYSTGKAGEQRARSEAELAEARAMMDAQIENQRFASKALTRYQAAHASIQAQLERTRGEAREALNRPTLTCPPTLGDAVVPGDLGRMLNAIDQAGEASPTGQRAP